MNRSVQLFWILSLFPLLGFGFEKVSDYSYLGLESCTNYPGYSFWSPYEDDKKQELYNERLLLPILKNLELAARFRVRERFDYEIDRLVALAAFISLDRDNGRGNRLTFLREVAYSFFRVIDGGFLLKRNDFCRIFSLKVFVNDGNWQVGRHLTFLRMVALSNAISEYIFRNNGSLPENLHDCPHVSMEDCLDVWGRKISYVVKGNSWQLYSRGPRDQPEHYSFDAYVPAIEMGLGTIQTYGVYLSSSFSRKRKRLFQNRSIPYVVNNMSFECRLNSFNVLTDCPQKGEGEVKRGVYISSLDFCLKIAEEVFAERFGEETSQGCAPYVADVQGDTYVVRGTKKTKDGQIPILEMTKSSGRIIRCTLM